MEQEFDYLDYLKDNKLFKNPTYQSLNEGVPQNVVDYHRGGYEDYIDMADELVGKSQEEVEKIAQLKASGTKIPHEYYQEFMAAYIEDIGGDMDMIGEGYEGGVIKIDPSKFEEAKEEVLWQYDESEYKILSPGVIKFNDPDESFNAMQDLKDAGFLETNSVGIGEDFKSRLKEQVASALEVSEKKDDKEPKKPKKKDKADTDEEVDDVLGIEDESNLDIEDDLGLPDDEGIGGEEDSGDVGGGEQEGLSPDEKQIQDSLKSAYDNAMAVGDKKLAKQIGNTITMFTRTHVVGGVEQGMMEKKYDEDIPGWENDEETMVPRDERDGYLEEAEAIQTPESWNAMDVEERFYIVLEFVKDPDEAFDVADRDFDELPHDIQANITRESKEINEEGDDGDDWVSLDGWIWEEDPNNEDESVKWEVWKKKDGKLYKRRPATTSYYDEGVEEIKENNEGNDDGDIEQYATTGTAYEIDAEMDGETIQNILEALGMFEQIGAQYIRTAPMEHVQGFLDERP